mgnify:FL=1|jgi:uncharacterized membrane protein
MAKMLLRRLLEMEAKSILNTKVWLTIIGVMHLLMGVIVNYMENGSEDNLAGFGFFAMISFYLLYVAFMITGQVQARLAVIFCGPVVVWFIVCMVMDLSLFGAPVAPMPEAVLPLVLWGMPALCGILDWNMDESAAAEA